MDREHVEALIDRYFDGIITAEEHALLERELQASPDTARRFLHAGRMDFELYRHFHEEEADRLFQAEQAGEATRTGPAPYTAWGWIRRREEPWHWWGPVGAVLINALIVFALVRWVNGPDTSRTDDELLVDYVGVSDSARRPGRDTEPGRIETGVPDVEPRLASEALPPGATMAPYDPFAEIITPPARSLMGYHHAGPPLASVTGPELTRIRRTWGSLSPRVERACRQGQDWIAGAQQSDGRWSEAEGDLRSTALALLALQSRGVMPRSPEQGLVVTSGLRWMLTQQGPDGWFGGAPGHSATHALALAAVSKGYALTRIPSLAAARDLAVEASLRTQRDDGLWEGGPGETTDMIRATLFQVMALYTCEADHAGTEEIRDALRRAAEGLMALYSAGTGASYAYGLTSTGQSAGGSRPDIRAIAVALQWTGRPIPMGFLRTARAAMSGAMDLRRGHEAEDWMTASQLAFHFGGRDWTHWRDRHLPGLLARQGAEGAWEFGGRLKPVESTAWALLALTVNDPGRAASSAPPELALLAILGSALPR